MSDKTSSQAELDKQLLDKLTDSPFRSVGAMKAPDSKGDITTWGKEIYEGLVPIRATLYPHPAATYTLHLDEKYGNLLGNLHGGAAATIFDIATTMTLALVQSEGFWQHWGVSRTLSCTYLRPAQVNRHVTIHCEVVSFGKRLVHIKGSMKDRDGKVLVTCEHDKVNTDTRSTKL
ncbi:hypothetical protein DRE_07766 [Drechslerella stenobrocha 248]|uniref:Thioesterase domain-containing protein n=1 Tax=Drechslerella stenobrocha 248 TaxID=1043628 RepID=W7I7M1_9PEZI|nr:hypothetical protein DRE_07766 [Drechslerella stenobrocha 248]